MLERATGQTKVIVVGFPRKEAVLAAERIKEATDTSLVSFTLAEDAGIFQAGDSKIFQIAPRWHENRLEELRPDVIVDFSTGDVSERNVDLYCRCGIPFVKFRSASIPKFRSVREEVEKSEICAVVLDGFLHDLMVFEAIKFLLQNKDVKGKAFNLLDMRRARKHCQLA
jgi:dihydrodipicolinate reductase